MEKTKPKEEQGLAVHILLDCSGSMIGQREETVIAFNKYVEELATAITPATVTLVTFTYSSNMIIDAVPVFEMPHLVLKDYEPDGGTSLYDAIHERLRALETVNARHRALVILTDGQDGDSWVSLATVRGELARLRKAGWLILFLAANGEAMSEVAKLKMPAKTVLRYDTNVTDAMTAAAQATLRFGMTGNAKDGEFSDNERRLEKADA